MSADGRADAPGHGPGAHARTVVPGRGPGGDARADAPGRGPGAARAEASRRPVLEPEGLAVGGIEFRTYRGEADLPGVMEAVNRSLESDGVDDGIGAEDAYEEFGKPTPRRDPAKDVFLALADGRIAGVSRTGWYEELEGKRMYCVSGYLEPGLRGKGVLRALLRLAEGRARESAAVHPAGARKILQAWSAGPEADWPALLASEGYREVRHFWDMLRPIDGTVPEGRLPPGLVSRPARPEDLRAVWEALRDVAPDHWQYRGDEWTEEAFAAWRAENEGGTALWQLAWDGGRVAGTVLAGVDAEGNARRGRKRGLTEHVFVRKEWRGKGVATALLAAALEALEREGMEEAFLGVDEENPSGAMRFYESLGYRAARKDTWHRKWLVEPEGAREAWLY